MTETKVDFVEKEETKTTRKKKVFKAKCYHCKEKETFTMENGVPITLPFAYIDVPKDKDLLKQCKDLVKESEEKYGNKTSVKKALYKFCPKCGHTINLDCNDYVEFFAPKKKTTKKVEEVKEESEGEE